MNPPDRIPPYRSLRLHEWLLLLALMGLIGGVRAAPVYRCVDDQGHTTFQDRACAVGADETQVELPPAPRYTPSPQYALDTRDETPARRSAKAPRQEHETAYECRAGDGEVFYRLDHCPRTIAAQGTGTGSRKRRGGAGGSVTVSARAIPREQACAEMHRGGAIGRSGHEHDDTVSTYDRNLGKDPCR